MMGRILRSLGLVGMVWVAGCETPPWEKMLEKGHLIPPEQLPAEAQKTMEEIAPGATINTVEQFDDGAGSRFFRVTYTKDGRPFSIRLNLSDVPLNPTGENPRETEFKKEKGEKP